jgi:hypothetical protein
MRLQPSSVGIGLIVGVVAGLVIGVVLASAGIPAIGGPPGGTGTGDGPDPADPPGSLSTATGCVPGADVGTGWAHEVASGDSRTFTANVTVAHDARETVNASFETIRPGEYAFRVDVVEGGKGGSPGCATGSTAQVAASLPVEYESVTVVVDGETIATVANDGDTIADLYRFSWGNATTTAVT